MHLLPSQDSRLQMAAQNVTSAREIRVAKKGRRIDQISNRYMRSWVNDKILSPFLGWVNDKEEWINSCFLSKGAGNGLDLSKSFGSKASVIR